MATPRGSRSKRTGLGTVGLNRDGARSVITQMRDQEALEEIQQITLDHIAHDPDNPPSRHDVDPELVASIEQVGVLQPIVVVPVDVWLVNRPDHSDALAKQPEARYVAWIGNRRKTNSQAAGKSTIPSVVRHSMDALAQDTGKVHENTKRRGLAPSEEARSLHQALEHHGLTQRSLAEHLGTSEPRISKLLRLLQLPEPVLALVDARAVSIEAALTLLREDRDVVEKVGSVVGDEHESIDIGRMIMAAKQQLTADRNPAPSPTDVPHPLSTLPKNAPEGRDTDEAESPSASEVTISPQPPAQQPPSPSAVTAPKAGQVTGAGVVGEPEAARESSAVATRAREEALRVVTQRPAASGVMTQAVAAAWLGGQSWGSQHRPIARELLTAAGFEQLVDHIGSPEWAKACGTLSTRKALHAGWILTLCVQEASVREAGERWSAGDREYVRWLADSGYTPTDWELGLLEQQEGVS